LANRSTALNEAGQQLGFAQGDGREAFHLCVGDQEVTSRGSTGSARIWRPGQPSPTSRSWS